MATSTITSPTTSTLPDDRLRAQVGRGRVRGAQQQIAEMVGEHAVELLGHRAVERAHPRLDVHHRDAACAAASAPASVELVSP